ncbi:hypothetical protein KBB60_01445 [Patescibacteria group bacterium]|nr:hypothetical protein [Patescibacteria group bacterium]
MSVQVAGQLEVEWSKTMSVQVAGQLEVEWYPRQELVTNKFLLEFFATPPRHRRGSGFQFLYY